MEKDSQKVLETKQKIKDAFFEIYENKKIERISIKEITDKANLNRGTFYVYYKDIYDLLEKTEDDMIEELTEKIKSVVTDILREKSEVRILLPVEFYKFYSKYLRVLLGDNGDPGFVRRLKELAKKNLRELLKQEQMPIIPNLDYVLEYVSSAQIGILTYWVEKEMELSIDELERMIRYISMNGPISYLKSEVLAIEKQKL